LPFTTTCVGAAGDGVVVGADLLTAVDLLEPEHPATTSATATSNVAPSPTLDTSLRPRMSVPPDFTSCARRGHPTTAERRLPGRPPEAHAATQLAARLAIAVVRRHSRNWC